MASSSIHLGIGNKQRHFSSAIYHRSIDPHDGLKEPIVFESCMNSSNRKTPLFHIIPLQLIAK